MTEQPLEPQETETGRVEEIDVAEVPEPETPEEGVIDPGDTHVEGVDAGEAGDPQ